MRVDVLHRQAAGGEVGELRRQRLDAGAEVDEGQLAGFGGGVRRVDHQRVQALFGEHARQARQHGTVVLDVRVGDDRHDDRLGRGEHAPQAVGLVSRRGAAMTGHVRDYVRACGLAIV